jgi:hypothetical protein
MLAKVHIKKPVVTCDRLKFGVTEKDEKSFRFVYEIMCENLCMKFINMNKCILKTQGYEYGHSYLVFIPATFFQRVASVPMYIYLV